MGIESFDEAHLEQICNVLADTNTGLTGTEIGVLLTRISASDPQPTITKRKRLFQALSIKQQRDGCGNNIAAFIQQAMNPVRYAGASDRFDTKRAELNTILAFAGYEAGDDGKLRKKKAARTLDEAEQRAHRLHAELTHRGVHPDVLRFCQAELLQDNFFHAVFEATKSVADKIRQKSGLPFDGSELVDQAFGLGKSGCPVLALSSLQTDTERSEQKGFINLLKGMFGTFRNVTAHAPKIKWPINEQDAMDLMVLASLLHRRLDATVNTAPCPRTTSV